MFRKVCVLAVVTAALGCGEDATSLEESIAGTYQLHSISDKELPYTSHEDDLLTVVYTAGLLALKVDRTFSLSLTFVWDTGQSSSTTTQEHSGSWVASESGVTITYVEGHTDTVLMNGDMATIVWSGDAFLFQR